MMRAIRERVFYEATSHQWSFVRIKKEVALAAAEFTHVNDSVRYERADAYRLGTVA